MSQLLLDTHTFLWCLSDVEQLAEDTRTTIADPHNDVFVSAITGGKSRSSEQRVA